MTDRAGAVTPLLEVESLCTSSFTRAGVVKAVDDVSFALAAGEVLALVGESGSGKSAIGYSLMGLIDPPGRIVGGSIRLAGVELTTLSAEGMRRLRGNRLAMIFEDPMMMLNPVLRVDRQMTEAILAHARISERAALSLAREALVKAGIASPDERLNAYPHQLSRGMRQRLAVAIALVNRPDLIIADEPTSALDVTIQRQMLYEVQKPARETGAALIWITRDLSLIAALADRICVMYAGRIVEQGAAADVLAHPAHPYTQGLLDSMPSRNPPGERLRQIPGGTPPLLGLAAGCAFRERCAKATPICHTLPRMMPAPRGGDAHAMRCHHPQGG